jgi:3-hydroxybutyrate dehydrogenase
MLNGLGDACAIESLQTNMQAQHHVQVAYHPADLTKKAEIRDMVEHCKQKFGSLDILVNNAGAQARLQPRLLLRCKSNCM